MILFNIALFCGGFIYISGLTFKRKNRNDCAYNFAKEFIILYYYVKAAPNKSIFKIEAGPAKKMNI